MSEKSILRVKNYLIETISKAESDPYGVVEHVEIVERWAKFILKNHPEADKEITLISVWLHDIGHYPLDDQDHAQVGEKIALTFLRSINFPKEKIQKIAHCVRAHRCRDVQPQTIEAKIVACADSASHFIDYAYTDMMVRNKKLPEKKSVIEKLERDYRDISLFPEVKSKLEKLYLAWKMLIPEFEKINEEI